MGVSYPSYTPSELQTVLTTMAGKGQLSGIAPAWLAAIAQAESGSEVKGAGVNSEGFGGFFGLHATWTYGGVKVSRAQLETGGEASLRTQAMAAAAELHSLTTSLNAGPIAVTNAYVNGTKGGPDYSVTATLDAKLVAQALGLTHTAGPNPTASAAGPAPTPSKPTNPGTAGGVVTDTPINKLTSPFDAIAGFIDKIDNLTWWRRVGIFAGGSALIVLGLVLLIQGSKSVRSAESGLASDAAVAAIA